ncbi:Acyl-ACP thioesterase [Marvinbryantia formatexigens DSM 14469]|uniref:Acyl-ACP thioesterase n=1 Tax=Marvinbryantia formatexigens DSM 14469 TaxID=478749 RepID=C6LLV8_9FIRM|nr:acyl-ACP thioesterase domain-containing protein [Marvinbryantia formatexigens]EET58368.1 Acyl-ACP thioesterase [Marvinbryantia formatexigens DSM 14469]UWO24316.1 thioesterase [Marvinbryantia formatexigens DSM 14469]SDF54459.1 Acyl-ACP thioesterase [Marvinbryantia formatexigens]
MIFEKQYLPQFREADRDGYVGLRGYMNYFQDMATHYMHNLGKGNDTIPEKYGIVWMYTKYRMQVFKKADFTGEIKLETWVPQWKLSSIIHQNLRISRDGEEYARGTLECCLYHLEKKRLVRLKEIEFPANIAENRDLAMPEFRKLPTEMAGMEYAYTHKIRYTDLDKTGHMTNLKYVDLFLNASDSGFYENFQIEELELHFLRQCYEKEVLHVYKKRDGRRLSLLAVNDDKVPCAAAELLGRKEGA